MELFEAIHTRRSIRKYQDREVPFDLIKKILAAAMMAPSTGDARTWHFILVTDPDKKARIREVHPYVKMVTKAPLGILVCGDLSREKFPGFWPQDCSAAMQNLLLAAHASGLGAVWTGIHPIEDRITRFKEIFDLPDHIHPLGLAVIGWPAQERTAEERYTEECIHHNRWQDRASTGI
ncbi:nitroreductase family protein [Desulfospira joergensenii]|uniref:nitroreductase family protein n=1 Tax=Desulfospira joergensenii TaxID=53329 RepID=UPI0003B43755|nr:nitroreductase family protein [Desulfospira joergensenii]